MALSSALRLPPSEALKMSQETSDYLRKNARAGSSTIPIPFFSSAESTNLWSGYEKHFLLCLRAGNDKAAHLCLEKLISRFGATNERVMALHGLYQEALAKDDAALERILLGYDEVLADDPANVPIAKRRIALLQSLERISDAIDALIELLEYSPTDIEAWVELSDLYLSLGLYQQAAFCLEETLLSAPNAWNVHARLGEILFIHAGSSSEGNEVKLLAEALRRYCRSIELCDDYLRGYYGLKLTSDRLMSKSTDSVNTKTKVAPVNDNGLAPPSPDTIRRLNELATSKLAEIIRRGESAGYDPAELVAARDLLSGSTQAMIR